MRSRRHNKPYPFAIIVGLLLATSLLTTTALAQQSPAPLVFAVDSVGITVSDMDRSVEFYFRDPDGHNLEILQFPPDKGDPRWHRLTNRLFLGIDHTAIVVSDTDASLTFYRDVLGLKVAGESENYGPEQERLNNVFGARLRITTLRAAAGPAIEFLEYLTPRDGRPYPADHRANDLVHWQTRVVTADAGVVARDLRAGKAPFVSSGVTSLPEGMLGFTKDLQVRDPDGHVMQVIQR